MGYGGIGVEISYRNKKIQKVINVGEGIHKAGSVLGAL